MRVIFIWNVSLIGNRVTYWIKQTIAPCCMHGAIYSFCDKLLFRVAKMDRTLGPLLEGAVKNRHFGTDF